jgi:hypothetical protein
MERFALILFSVFTVLLLVSIKPHLLSKKFEKTQFYVWITKNHNILVRFLQFALNRNRQQIDTERRTHLSALTWHSLLRWTSTHLN